MSRWGKFFALPAGDRSRLVGYSLLLLVIQAGLTVFGTRRVHAFLAAHPRNRGAYDGGEEQMLAEARRTAYLVSAAGRHGLVKATCLRQALLTWWLLRRQGIESELRIGIQKRDGRIYGHAWVRAAGQVVSEGEQVEENFSAFEGYPTGE